MITPDSKTVFSFNFNNTTFPESDQAVSATKEYFDSALFGLTGETDSSIIRRWSTFGYPYGLFGETRTDLGAFYFDT